MEHWHRRDVLVGLGAVVGLGALGIGFAGRASAATPLLAGDTGKAELMREIAPSGRLRVAVNFGNVVLAQRSGPHGASGVSVDIAYEIGRRLDLPVDLILYDAAGAAVSGMARDKWDVAFLAVDPTRGEQIDFTPPYVYIDGTYMVRAGSSFHSATDLDRQGVRIAVGNGAAYDLYLTRTLRNATIVRADSSPAAIAQFYAERLDAVAGVRQALVAAQSSYPHTRVLSDRFNRIEQAIAVPKGRADAVAYLSTMIDELKASGFVRQALDRSGQADATVAK